MSLVAQKGVLITCDIPTMQVIKFMDKAAGGNQNGQGIIIKELDERNVFIHRTFRALPPRPKRYSSPLAPPPPSPLPAPWRQ